MRHCRPQGFFGPAFCGECYEQAGKTECKDCFLDSVSVYVCRVGTGILSGCLFHGRNAAALDVRYRTQPDHFLGIGFCIHFFYDRLSGDPVPAV